jgi:hypothetical protein
MSDTIRTALEVATRTACGCGCFVCQKGCTQQVAEEIAAFLRALPIGLPTADKPSPFAFVSEEVKQQWVEAVLAAAKDNQP